MLRNKIDQRHVNKLCTTLKYSHSIKNVMCLFVVREVENCHYIKSFVKIFTLKKQINLTNFKK